MQRFLENNSPDKETNSTTPKDAPGPPLKIKRENSKGFTSLILGDKIHTQKNKTILLVGETGAGKSTLVNSIIKYSMGVKFEQEVWRKQERSLQTESETSDVIAYQFECKDPEFPLTIIDTPGYGSIRGIKHDDMLSHKLYDFFQSEGGVDEINAVGLVMKATDNRLSDRLMYVFDSVMSLFGKDMERNIVALITHSDGRHPRNALQALEAAKLKSNCNFVHFLFNKSQHEDRTEDREITEHANKTSLNDFRKFMIFLENTNPQPLKTTLEVLGKRISLKTSIQNLKDNIPLIELKQTEIRQIKKALKKHEEEMKQNENFTVEVDEAYKDKEPIRGGRWGLVFYEGAVTCPVCEENCHYPGCTMAWKPKYCEVMNDDHCTVCTNRCPASDHVKKDWRYVTKTRKVQKTLEDVKEKYKKNKGERENMLNVLKNLEMEKGNLTNKWSSQLDQAYKHVISLGEIALKVESVSTVIHVDFLIEKMKGKGDKEKLENLEKMKIKVDEVTKTALRYAQLPSLE